MTRLRSKVREKEKETDRSKAQNTRQISHLHTGSVATGATNQRKTWLYMGLVSVETKLFADLHLYIWLRSTAAAWHANTCKHLACAICHTESLRPLL